MDGGKYDVARLFLPELDYPFAQVRVDHLDAMRFKVCIEVAFLGQHGFAFHHLPDLLFPKDLVDDFIVLFCVLCPVNMGSVHFEG